MSDSGDNAPDLVPSATVDNEPAAAATAPSAAPAAATPATAPNEAAAIAAVIAAAGGGLTGQGDAQRYQDREADQTYADYDTVRLRLHKCVMATYGPDNKPAHEVTDYIQGLQAQRRTVVWNGIHNAVGDPAPGQQKVFRIWYDPNATINATADAANSLYLTANKPKSLFLALEMANPFFLARGSKTRKKAVPGMGGTEPETAAGGGAAAGDGAAVEPTAGDGDGDKPENEEMMTMDEKKARWKVPPHMADRDACFPAVPETKDDVNGQMEVVNPEAGFDDEWFYKTGPSSPNDFQKTIELLVRLRDRNINYLPPDALEPITAEAAAESDQPWNYWRGFKLIEDNMFLSPDQDTMYFKLHAERSVLLHFAEAQKMTLRTNPYSYGGGAGMAYSTELDKTLTKSVKGFMKHFADDMRPEDEYCKGKWDEDKQEYKGWGFCVEVPQKMRLLVRLLREGWAFSGCGLSLDIMKERQVFILNYFPLHNENYVKDEKYQLDKWASFLALCNPCECCNKREQAIVHYFGESVAIYFAWIREYVYQLTLPAIVGLICGVLQEALHSNGRDVVGAIYSIFIVIWAVHFIRKWQRTENRFAITHGQDIEQRQELVRDEFIFQDKRRVDVQRIYTMDFEFPLTMQRTPDGTMVELVFSSTKRSLRRYLFSWPILVIWAAGMVGALFFTEWYRQRYPDDISVNVGASIVSVLTTIIFSSVSTILIDMMNDYENCRTDQEYDDETVIKSFCFLFVATYFAVFTIAFWPGISNDTRVNQLKSQMVVQQMVMPLVGNATELILPKVLTGLQRRVDTLGGYCVAICSYFCCCCGSCECCDSCDYAEKSEFIPTNEQEEHGHEVWRQSGKQRYVSTASDYLEVIIVFGYMMMFAAVFPWGAVAALVYNFLEIRIDAVKLLHDYQRPIARTAQSIGSWNGIMFLLTGLSIVTNSYYIAVVGAAPRQLKMKSGFAELLEYFSYLQYFIAIACLLLGMIRNVESDSVKKQKVKLQLLADQAVQKFVRDQLNMTHEELAEDARQANETIKNTVKMEEGCRGCCFLC